MKHRMVVVAVCLAVVPMLLGAEITLDKVTPNPGGMLGSLILSGTFGIDAEQMEVLDKVEGRAKSTTFENLIYTSVAAVDGKSWTATWPTGRLPADTYECIGRLYYVIMYDPTGAQYFVDSAARRTIVR